MENDYLKINKSQIDDKNYIICFGIFRNVEKLIVSL